MSSGRFLPVPTTAANQDLRIISPLAGPVIWNSQITASGATKAIWNFYIIGDATGPVMWNFHITGPVPAPVILPYRHAVARQRTLSGFSRSPVRTSDR